MSTWWCRVAILWRRSRFGITLSAPRVTVRGLETGDELLHRRIKGQHTRFRRGAWTGCGQPFLLIDRGERRDGPRPLARGQEKGDRLRFSP